MTTPGPIYRALWEPESLGENLFRCESDAVPADVQRVMTDSLEVLRQHRTAKTLRGSDGKHSPQVLRDLGSAGYWGLLVQPEFGGAGCGLKHFLPFLSRTAVIDAPLAGLAAVHGCIGAVDPLQTFGTSEQRQRWLPQLASGERLSAFASTEPGAGSDLSSIQMTAVRDGETLRLTGQKAFITNLAPGRSIGLLCKLDDKLAVVVVDLPEQEYEHFQLVPNPLHPLKHTINQGLRFQDFVIPRHNLLEPPVGKDGRAIVFHGLNRGRAAICALAAGHLRVILAGMIAWAKERTIRNQPLASLELIQARLGRVAALIAGCDLLAQWCGQLLDAGYRADVECITAKVFASESLKHAIVDLALPTHGGRFFLQGHAAGDMLYDYLAPCIYEGENELLCLATYQQLAKGYQGLTASRPRSKDPMVAGWRSLRWNFEDLLHRPKPQADLLPTEMVQIVEEVQMLTLEGLLHGQLVPPNSLTDQARRLLSWRLRRKLGLFLRVTLGEFRQEVELGKAILASPPEDLADAPTFVNPLRCD